MWQMLASGKLKQRVDRNALFYFSFAEGVTLFKIESLREGKKMIDLHVLTWKKIQNITDLS